MAGTLKHITGDGRTKFGVVTETSSTAAEPNVELVSESVTLTCNAGGNATVSVISDARVGTGRQFYLHSLHALISGASHGASKEITLYDGGDNSVAATAQGTNTMVSATFVSLGVCSVGGTANAGSGFLPTSLAYGATSGKGLYLKSTGTTTTSVISAVVNGVIK